jgi:hypothetical protein
MKLLKYLVIVCIFTGCKNVNTLERYDLYNEDIGSIINYVSYNYDTILKKWVSLPDSSASIECEVVYPKINDNYFIKSFLDSILRITLRAWLVDTIMPEWSISDILNQTINSFKELIKSEETNYLTIKDFTYSTSFNVIHPFDKIWILKKNHYSYTGGAHGYYYEEYYSFIENNLIKDIRELIKDTIKFKELQIEYLKKQCKIPTNVDLSEAGFFVSDESFFLTNNFFFTPDTFYTCYNPYDIACFADGIQRIAVPMSNVLPLLKDEKKQYFKK